MTCARLRRAQSLAIRCYSKAWAAAAMARKPRELAAMLSEDGVPATILVWDFFKGSVHDSGRAATRQARAGRTDGAVGGSLRQRGHAGYIGPSAPAGASGFGHHGRSCNPPGLCRAKTCAAKRSSPGSAPARARNPITTTARATAEYRLSGQGR